MYEAVFVTPWPWWAAGSAIGLVVTLLAWFLGKPLGVSTGYGVACAPRVLKWPIPFAGR